MKYFINYISDTLRLKFLIKNHILNNYYNVNIVLFYIKYFFTFFFSSIIPYNVFVKYWLFEPINSRRSLNFVFDGFYDYKELIFLLHYLKDDDIFFDVGANIGLYSIAATLSDVSKIYSFEPSIISNKFLTKNVLYNNLDNRVVCENYAISNCKKMGLLTSKMNVSNKMLDDNVLYKNINIKSELVPTISLNEYCNLKMVIPSFLKIDIEGYEYKAIVGANELISNSKLNVILIEMNGHGSKFYNFDEKQIITILCEKGFKAYYYDPFKRKLNEDKTYNSSDILFIRNIDLANKKVKKASRINMREFSI